MSGSDLEVSGGAGGLEADLADLAALGRNSTDLAEMLAATSLTCHGMLVDPDVLASAVLNPAGVARFEAALLEALDGPGGLSALALRFAARAATLQAAAVAYRAADEALAEMADALDWATGAIPGGLLASVLGQVTGALLSDPRGPVEAVRALIDDPQKWLTEHPGLVDSVVNKVPGLASRVNALTGGLLSPWIGGGDVRSAAARLGRLWPDGEPVVRTLADDERGVVTRAPRNVTDLLDALDQRARDSGPDEDQVSVRVVTQPDGTKAYIVDIPGTQDWSPPGLSPNSATNDLGTNVRVLGGDATTRQEAIAEALRRAGAGSTDPVMLVGHSQGGMVAAQAAHDSGTADFPYDVRSVVTMGSPIARADVPPSVQVLALENAHDLVPHLDGRSNDDDPNVTTVTFEAQYGSVGENHGIGSAYRDGSQLVDRSDDPSIAAWRQSAAPFLAGPGDAPTVDAHVYSISRR
ncbi:alpha/beta hydrolase [Blastococcus sp. TBT05-19]|uniref:lipase family alpha/beta hydrolase n=1 Tax=Blastococcus sp. TBT05-19 TaxID=2250581 RepID=UPI000DE8B377|nr:alpha/beta fold hydrolase [Blastococcus sp. TBT05-19]RBY94817.1 alpha/beta hydrolase [Blastococcus sp. TBT05-19]